MPLSANKCNYSRMRLVNELKKINVRGSIFSSISLLSFNFLEKLSGQNEQRKELINKQ